MTSVLMVDLCADGHEALKTLPALRRFASRYEGVQDDYEGGWLKLFTCCACGSTFAMRDAVDAQASVAA